MVWSSLKTAAGYLLLTYTKTTSKNLVQFIEGHGLDEHKAMMYLRDTGTISDNCITLSDVANADCPAAFEWLKWFKRRQVDRK